MASNPEYTSSPWADHLPSDPAEALRARNAFVQLMEHFRFNSFDTMTPQERTDTSAKLLATINTYFALSVRAAAEGMGEEDKKVFIKDGLKAERHIDQSDPVRADEEYTIISEGYELNRKYWDEKLGKRRRFINDMLDMR